MCGLEETRKWCLIRATAQSLETLASPLCSKVGGMQCLQNKLL